MRETQVRSLGQEDPLEKEMATHSSILAWEIPWLEEPGGLQSMGPRVWHDWATSFFPLELQRPAQGLRLRRPPGGSVQGAGGASSESPRSREDPIPPFTGDWVGSFRERESEATLQGITVATFPSQVMAPARRGQHFFTFLCQRDAVRLWSQTCLPFIPLSSGPQSKNEANAHTLPQWVLSILIPVVYLSPWSRNRPECETRRDWRWIPEAHSFPQTGHPHTVLGCVLAPWGPGSILVTSWKFTGGHFGFSSSAINILWLNKQDAL